MSFTSKVEEMKRLYVDEKKTLAQVGEILGCSNKNVEYHLKKNGVKLRTRSEALIGREISEKDF